MDAQVGDISLQPGEISREQGIVTLPPNHEHRNGNVDLRDAGLLLRQDAVARGLTLRKVGGLERHRPVVVEHRRERSRLTPCIFVARHDLRCPAVHAHRLLQRRKPILCEVLFRSRATQRVHVLGCSLLPRIRQQLARENTGMRCIENDEALDKVGTDGCQYPCDGAAPVMPNQRDRPFTKLLNESGNVRHGRPDAVVLHALRLLGFVETAQVRRHQAIAGKLPHDIPPAIPELRESMQQHDGFTLAGEVGVQLHAIGRYRLEAHSPYHLRMLLFVLLSAPALFANDALLQTQGVKRALAYLQANHERHLDKQVQIAEIPAPTFHEQERAKFMAAEFRRVGLKDVEIDKQGNVLGWRPGKSDETLVLAAHLDISFAPGVNTKVRKEGGRWHGPGLSDDSRGLTALLALAEAMDHAAIQTNRTILFVANVGEEGLGDLIGVRYLFQQSPYKRRFRSFISIDGANPARIVNAGTGVKRYRVTLRGPGGHSYGNFGRPSPVHAMGGIISRIAAIETPAKPKTTFNVGRIGGGTAVNAIAEESWFEVDLRSEGPSELDRLELKMHEAVRSGLEEENQRRAASEARLTSEVKLVSNRPGGTTDPSQPIVQAALWAARATGHQPTLGFGSTDSNLPISLGVPAVTLGGGGRADNHHSLDEWFEPEGAWKGPQMVLLAILAFDKKD